MMTLNRRDLLKLTGLGAAFGMLTRAKSGEFLSRLTAALSKDAQTRGDILVCVFQRGGMDGLNAVIPYGDLDYYRLRPFLAVPEPQIGTAKTAIDLDGFFGLHPSLLPLKAIWDEQALAIIHAAGSPDPTHSHFDAMDFMEHGAPGDKSVQSGWLARYLAAIGNESISPLRAVSIGTMVQSALRGPVPAMAISTLDEFRLGRRYDIPRLPEFKNSLTSLFRLGSPVDASAGLALEAAETVDGISTEAGLTSTSVEYPQSYFGRSMRLLAQLIRAEVGLEAATVDIGGWDTHINQGPIDGQMPRLLSDLSQSLAAFYQDMGEEMRRITVVTMSEFGRRCAENSGGGTDHGHGNVMFVMSRNVNGGKVYGQWPGLARGSLVGPGDLAITTDFRTVLGELIQKRLVNDGLTAIFPGFTQSAFLGLAK